MKVIHNVYFNGNIAFDEGIAAINKANEDDYTTILRLYPISNPATQQSATSQMDKSIEKCRKCIKLHSIHVKPKKINAKRRNDPEYKAWLQSKEFNNQMWRAWMLLGQSEFHKGDFLGSVGTFSYISKLYEKDPDIVAQCQVWIARAYAEMGWLYEAETMLNKVKIDNLKRKHQPFYSAVHADILLKGEQYTEAIPFVKVARENEKKKGYKPRFEYVLAQLYQNNGQKDAACAGYKRVMNMQPEHVMHFNAQLRYYELSPDSVKHVKKLLKMVKKMKNKDVLDQLYGTLGNIYLSHHDTTKAVEYYQLAIDKSTRNGKDKAGVLLLAGELYYNTQRYEEAAPCYKEAVQILPNTDTRYPIVSTRNQALEELVQRTQTISLQDSLQYLSTLSEEEQKAIVDKIIADLIEKEKADSISATQEERNKELNGGPLEGVNTEFMVGTPRDNSWYFYNETLIKKGKQSFSKQWGDRPLEDNWRRKSKTQSSSSFTPAPSEESTDFSIAESEGDSISASDSTAHAEPVTDPHQPEYYLQQIPCTEEDIQASNTLIADALYDLIYIYKDQLQDFPKSKASFRELQERFPNDARLVDIYYMLYLSSLQREQADSAEYYRQELLQRFPTSKQAQIVSNPDYASSLARTAKVQDSLYEATYEAYRKGNYTTVQANKLLVEKDYPLTSLMPRFLFLNAIGRARTEGQKAFTEELQDMVDRYPDHELSTLAKDMLAMMGEGLKSQKGGAMGGLQEARGQVQEEEVDSLRPKQYLTERKTASLVLIVIGKDEQRLNNLLFQVALFNFTQFLIKDFDLQLLAAYSPTEGALQISGLESMDEAEWYISLLQEDATIKALLAEEKAKVIPITTQNFNLLNSLGEEAYLQFLGK